MELREKKDRASELFSKKKFAKARSLYEELVRTAPADPHLRMRLADTCLRLEVRDTAAAHFREASALFEKQGQASLARAALRQALDVAPARGDS